MKRTWMLLVLALSALAGACSGNDIGTEYIEVSEEESGLQFYGPGLEDGFRRFLAGHDEYFVKRTTATFGPRSGEFPYARMHLSEMPPGRHFTRVASVVEIVDAWGWFEERAVTKGAKGTTVNNIGRIDFVPVVADGVSCVVWRQVWGLRYAQGEGTNLLDGYYCKGEGPMMSAVEAESIVKLVGHREHGAVDPPSGWPGMSGMRIQVLWANDDADVDKYEARIKLPTETEDGAIRIVPGVGRDCSGVVSYRGRREQVIMMSWSLSCADGMTANGTLRQRMYPTSSYLVGDGTDSGGRNVAIID